jgi:hypothetical protein
MYPGAIIVKRSDIFKHYDITNTISMTCKHDYFHIFIVRRMQVLSSVLLIA